MKKLSLTTSLLFLALASFSQKKDEVLLTINENPILTSEFKRVYEKNLDLVDDDAKDIDKNLDLFINYKLKVQEAYDLKLDTVKSYKKELKKYKQQLIAPYLRDEDFEKAQIKEAYNRTREEVRASHILILFPKDKNKIDTISMIAKLNAAKKRIEAGESFSELAKEISEDPSAKQNGGDLGYFSAFKMVYPFEEQAYKNEVGQISKPFKTRFGYHILKVFDKRLSRGELKAAHILVKSKKPNAKAIIDSVYQKLKDGIEFKQLANKYSDDTGSKKSGGVLPLFGSGRMVKPFEDQAFALQNEGDYSAPFKTRFGWHIVKLLKKYPVGSFEELEPKLKDKIKRSSLGKLSQKKVIEKLKKQYEVTENTEKLQALIDKKDVEENSTLFTINNKEFLVKDYKDFCKPRRAPFNQSTYDSYFNQEITDYFKKDLEANNQDFKNTLTEYKDCLLYTSPSPRDA